MLEGLTPAAVLFDLYGTLIDITTDEHIPELWLTLSRYLRYRHLVTTPESLYAQYLKLAAEAQAAGREAHPETDVQGIFSEVLRDMGCADADTVSIGVSQLFRALSIVHLEVFDDTVPALDALRTRYKVGLVSDAQRVFVDAELEMTGLASRFDAVVISGDHGYHKPDERLFSRALELLDVPPNRALYVGDNVGRDICGAKAAQMTAIFLDRSEEADPSTFSCTPDRVVHSMSELCDWLMSDDVAASLDELPGPHRGSK
jgi:putative hydrolase of the HAD superfamily